LASFFGDSGHEMTASTLPTCVIVTPRSALGPLGLIEALTIAVPRTSARADK